MKLTTKKIKEALRQQIKVYVDLATWNEEEKMFNTAYNFYKKAEVLRDFLDRIKYLEEN